MMNMNHIRSLLKLNMKDVPNTFFEDSLRGYLPDLDPNITDKLLTDHFSLCGQFVCIVSILEFLVFFYKGQFDTITPPGDLAGLREAHPFKEV